jgi:hypothetical protein
MMVGSADSTLLRPNGANGTLGIHKPATRGAAVEREQRACDAHVEGNSR